MDELEAIDRLHALKVKGLLTDEEFASEKERVFAGARAMPAAAVAPSASEPHYERSSYGEGYDGDRRRKVLFAIAGLGLLIGALWWAVGKPTLFGKADEPLEEYLVGSWVEYQPNELASVLCATDTGITFHPEWAYSELEVTGRWAPDGEAVEVYVDGAKTRYEILRQGDDRAAFTFDSEEGRRTWDAFRCPIPDP